jgi:hypothetical protein
MASGSGPDLLAYTSCLGTAPAGAPPLDIRNSVPRSAGSRKGRWQRPGVFSPPGVGGRDCIGGSPTLAGEPRWVGEPPAAVIPNWALTGRVGWSGEAG